MRFWLLTLVSTLVLTLSGCTPAAAPSPTAPPAKPVAEQPAAKPAAQPAVAQPAAKPTEKPAAKPTEKPAAKPTEKPAPKPGDFDEQAVADFYKGKTVRIIVGYGAGGVFDVLSRLLAKHMPRHIPGTPNIIVENKPGAGSLLAANAVYAVEPKDGTAIGSFHQNLPLQQALGAQGVQFDAARLNWLGSAQKTLEGCLARTDVGVSSIQEVMAGKQLVIGTTAPGSATYDVPVVLKSTLGLNFKMVPGYDGMPKIRLALESKEVDGFCVDFYEMEVLDRPLLDGTSPRARVLVLMGTRVPDHPFLKGVPAAEGLAKTDEARQMQRAVVAPTLMARPWAVAPEVPRDRVEALRKAMAAAFADAQLLAEVKQASLALAPTGGAEVQRLVQEVLRTPQPVLTTLKDVLK